MTKHRCSFTSLFGSLQPLAFPADLESLIHGYCTKKRYLSSLSACATTKSEVCWESSSWVNPFTLGCRKTFRNHLFSSRIPHPVSSSHKQYLLSQSFTLPSIYTVSTSVTDREELKGWRTCDNIFPSSAPMITRVWGKKAVSRCTHGVRQAAAARGSQCLWPTVRNSLPPTFTRLFPGAQNSIPSYTNK